MDGILSYEINPAEDFYHILGCSELSSAEQINAEYKARVLDCHPDKNPTDLQAAERFAQLSKAKDVLCDPESRAKYDRWKRSGIAMTYKDWCFLRAPAQAGMHWATKAPQPSLAEPPHTEPSLSSRTKPEQNESVAKETMKRGVSPSPGQSSAYHKPEQSESLAKETMKRGVSPSPGQSSAYHKAQRIDLTQSSGGDSLVTGDKVEWTPEPASGLLNKFRNYEI